MSCDDVKPALVGLLYEEIEPAERQAVEAHLGSCPECRAASAQIGETVRLLGRAEGDLPEAPAILIPARGRAAGARGGGERPRWSGLARLVAAALAAIVVPLVVLAATNSRIERDGGRWAAQFSLLPRPAARVDDGTLQQIRQQLESEIAERIQRERQATLDTINHRLEESRQALVSDLSVALARQEESLRTGYRVDRQEMLRRDRAVEQLVGNEMSRTREWLGQVLNASQQKAVVEQ